MPYALTDSLTLIGRSLRHTLRSVDALMTAAMLPVMLMLMFVYVFGGAIRTGTRYVDYVVPGIVVLCAGFGAASAAVAVCEDMTTGVIDRFRSLPIAGSAVLVGHVAANVVRNVVTTAIVLGVGLLVGFHPHGGALDWLAAAGVLLVFMLAISWLAAAFGLVAGSPETANAFSFLVMFLPYVSSAFVPTTTMPAGLRAFAAHQPATQVVETLRGLMMGTSTHGHVLPALAWCAGLALAGFVAASGLYRSRIAT